MHEADIKKFVDVIALEENTSPIVVRQAVMDMLTRYEGAESLSRKDYKRAQNTLKQQIRELQETIMPLPGEILSLYVESVADNGSAQGHTNEGVRVVLPRANEMKVRRRQTISVTVRSVDSRKNLVVASVAPNTAFTQMFASQAGNDLRLRAITRFPGEGALVGVEGLFHDPSDAEMARIELSMTVSLHEDVRLLLWSEDRAEVLRHAMPREAGITHVEIQGKQATVYADDLNAAIGPGALHARLASALMGYKIHVVASVHEESQVSSFAEACG